MPQQLGEELGRGSSGKVYRALNRETGDFRAIKEIPTQNMPVGHLESVRHAPPSAIWSRVHHTECARGRCDG